MSRLRDVLETKVSPTAVFHFVMNSFSDIGSFCKYNKQVLAVNKVRIKTRGVRAETNFVVTQNTQADLTHHLFDVHLPPLARIVDPSKPTHDLQCHLASDLVLELKGSGQL